jgi:hypothetical protein
LNYPLRRLFTRIDLSIVRAENPAVMVDPKDKPPDDKSREPTSVGERGGTKRSGRVAYDSRGNTIWEWQLETGVYTRDVNTQKLKKLDLGELSIADTVIQKKPEGLEDAAQSPSRGGFNPYDSSAVTGGGSNPYDNSHSVGGKVSAKTPEPSTPARQPTDMRKLDEWIKLKKSVKEKPEE